MGCSRVETLPGGGVAIADPIVEMDIKDDAGPPVQVPAEKVEKKKKKVRLVGPRKLKSRPEGDLAKFRGRRSSRAPSESRAELRN